MSTCSVLDCRQLQLLGLTAVNSTQAADIDLLMEQLQAAQQQQSFQLLAELEACNASQAAHIISLEQQDRVGTRVLAGLKTASAGKAADIALLRAQLQAAKLQLQGTEQALAGLQELQLVQSDALHKQQKAAGDAAELAATNADLTAKVERLESSQHTWLQAQQAATQQVQQLRARLAALEGEQHEAHKLRGQLEDAHSTIERLTQEVHQG